MKFCLINHFFVGAVSAFVVRVQSSKTYLEITSWIQCTGMKFLVLFPCCKRVGLRPGRSLGFDSWVGKIPWRQEWQPTPVFLPGESYGQKSLAGCSPWGRKKSDTTEWLTLKRVTLPRKTCGMDFWKSKSVIVKLHGKFFQRLLSPKFHTEMSENTTRFD